MNLCEIGLFHIVWGVSKATRDNYHEIWWNFFRTKMYRYIWILRGTGGSTNSTVLFLFIIKKNGKSTRAWPILKSNSTSFWFKKNFLGWIIKKLWKFTLLFLYKLSIVVLIDFIAILLTRGIFFRQIVGRNMQLIHFYIKNNIKMHFSKVEFLKIQNCYRHSLSIATRWNKLHWHQ